jgi:predicted dinucleotide-binding enzyme
VDITVIGTGGMARGIATRVLEGGHTVHLLGRDRDKAKLLAQDLQKHGSVRVAGQVVGDVVVLALYYGPAMDVLKDRGGEFAGKVLVEISNPVNETYSDLLETPAGSAAQEVAQAAPGARVVKAFNTTFATTLVKGEVEGHPLDVFVASDDDEAKATVMQLVADGGMRPVDSGGLARARHLESIGFVHVAVQDSLGTGYGSALKLLP